MRIVIALLFALSIAACNNSANQKAGEKETTKPAASKVVIENDTLLSVYNDYISLKTALVNSDSAAAKVAAGRLANSLNEVPGCHSAVKMAQNIISSSTLIDQRNNFVGINGEVIPVFKAADLTAGNIYVQFCPMANESKGAYWLSSDKKIMNPYYGEEMLECGEVREVVN